MSKKRIKNSSGDGPLNYTKPSFIIENRWWDEPAGVSIDQNGHVDIRHEVTPEGKARLDKWHAKQVEKIQKTRAHNLG